MKQNKNHSPEKMCKRDGANTTRIDRTKWTSKKEDESEESLGI